MICNVCGVCGGRQAARGADDVQGDRGAVARGGAPRQEAGARVLRPQDQNRTCRLPYLSASNDYTNLSLAGVYHS